MRVPVIAVVIILAGMVCVAIVTGSPMPLLLAAIVAGLLFVVSGINQVPEGHVIIIERLRRFVRVGGPGIVWVVPRMEQVVSTVRVRVRSEQFVVEDVLSAERLPLTFTIQVAFRLDFAGADRRRHEVVYFAPQQWRYLAKTHLEPILREVIRDHPAMEIIGAGHTRWREIQTAVAALLGDSLRDWGLALDTERGVVISNVQLPAQLQSALETAVTAGIHSSTGLNVLDMLVGRYPYLPQQVLMDLMRSVRGDRTAPTVIVQTDSAAPPIVPTEPLDNGTDAPQRSLTQQPSTMISIVRSIPARPEVSEDGPEPS